MFGEGGDVVLAYLSTVSVSGPFKSQIGTHGHT